MMSTRYLLVMRHAKSDWTFEDKSDFERDLNARGLKSAPMMATFLKDIDKKPDYILSSPAKRAKHTAELVHQTLGLDFDIHFRQEMYEGGPFDYVESIHLVPDDKQCVLLVGHNPLLEQLIAILTAERARSTAIMPTAGICCLQLELESWKEVKQDMAKVKWMMIPRVLDRIYRVMSDK